MLIDPLLGGIHGGSADELSVRAAAPQLESAMRTGRGLVRGLRAVAAGGPQAARSGAVQQAGGPRRPRRDAYGSRRPAFADVPDPARRPWVARSTRSRPRSRPAQLRTGAVVASLAPSAAGRVSVQLAGGEQLLADHVMLATPALHSAAIIERACPPAAAALRQIQYASVVTVLLAYPTAALAAPLGGSGFLVPRTEGRLITACTWASAKWPQLGGRSGAAEGLDRPLP